ncbi:Thymidine phosphorylase [Pseudomonas marincola]|uniref:Thymidine phosphorylase n=1 Tax=Pseudomonas marincola TaxID=437900 RepID=A0A653E1M4_9PSED|nr:DUF1631 domain-containing protein [Pseudomonas marincola]CAE6943621.1 Thymidine phosphorylase [Pseudomonas marincola]
MTDKEIPKGPKANEPTLARRGIQPRLGELALSCRKLLMNNLAENLTEVFNWADSALLEASSAQHTPNAQALFYDARSRIRDLRKKIEHDYHQKISHNFTEFFEAKARIKAPGAQSPSEEQPLTLIEPDVYEENMHITNMVNRVSTASAPHLYALEQRLALLNRGVRPDTELNPLGPRLIAEAFQLALKPHDLQIQIKVVLYKQFDRHVMSGLDLTYQAVNQLLIDGGILPNLKYSIRKPKSSGATGPAGGSHAPAAHAGEGTQPGAPAGMQAAPSSGHPGTASGFSVPETPGTFSATPPTDPNVLLSSLAGLMTEHRRSHRDDPLLGGTHSIAHFAPTGATRSYSAGELLDALNRMQQLTAQDIAKRLMAPQPVEALKADLHQQLSSYSDEPEQHKLTEQQANVIDLVGMLFDFILDDENLPNACKTVLSHLHTPYLKVALLDSALFSQHSHPARQLLNTMAQAGVIYGCEGEDSDLLGKMQQVVEQVINGFTGDLALFGELTEEFSAYVDTLKRKVELRERRAVETIKGRDKLLEAREFANEMISASLADREPPTIIRNFLKLTWTDVLVFIYLRHGRDSEDWQSACNAAEQLAWSGTVLEAQGLKRLHEVRVHLLESLHDGLNLLGGYNEEGIRRLLQDIVTCQHAVQARQPELAEKLNPSLLESQLGKMIEDQPAAKPEDSEIPPRIKALIKELELIEFGTWFECTTNTPSRRLKLSWFSPTTRNYMFVDNSGQRVSIKTLRELAEEVEKGLMRIIPADSASPIMDRALNAIYRIMQRFSGRTTETS